MRKNMLSSIYAVGIASAFVLALVASPAAASAQSTPEASAAEHPAHIHAGTCPDVGDVAYPLNMVVPLVEGMGTPDAMSSPMADMEMSATPSGDEVLFGSTTQVDASVEDILGSEHAVNLHLSTEQADIYIACGDLTGDAEGGELEIDLEEQNDSGVSGTATLTDNGDGTSTLVIEVQHQGANNESTPMSTPAS